MTGQRSREAIPLGGQVKLANPQAAFAFHLEGGELHNLTLPPAPAFASAEIAAEMVELYWQALTRDVPFADYGAEPLTAAAIAREIGRTDARAAEDEPESVSKRRWMP